MRKSTLLKLAGTFAAVMFSFGVMAQSYPATINTNYVEATETSYQTTGLGLRLYAAPDPVYSPNYATTPTPANINALSEWRWVYGVSFADAGATQIKPWTAAQNYVDIAAGQLPVSGTRLFWAAERFGAAGCADVIGKSHLVTVIAAPDATMVGANTGTLWTQLVAGREYSRCDAAEVDNLNIAFTEAATGYEGYAYNVTVTAIRYNIDGQPVDNLGAVIADPAGATDVTGTLGLATVADITTIASTDFVATPQTPAFGALTYLQVAGANVRTKYVFTLSGIASRISSLSHLRASIANAYYTPTVAQTVTYWLNLPPVTGPIYHIPNNYAF